MSKLKIMPIKDLDTRLDAVMRKFSGRIEATPPGICPVAMHLSLLQSGIAQTCGKCVPCREGLPQLEKLLKKVLDCTATEETLEELKTLAEMIYHTADCAIGYDAAAAVLEGIEAFPEEYESHIRKHSCTREIGQKVPCEALCPAHVNVPAYIALAQDGDYAGALNMIRKDNPFPTACAMVCEHPCENRCRRSIVDAPVNIRGIKKFIVDQTPADQVKTPPAAPVSGRKVAIIGSGPSGMTCAYFLALMGHKAVIYEEKQQLGGMLRYGIPAYRFPRERLEEDLRAILNAGDIEVRTGVCVGKEEMEQIVREFDAVYVSIGAHTSKPLNIEHVDAEGVCSAVALLKGIGDGVYPDFTGKKVAVIGGGNVAMDCARTALRAGAEGVSVVYRRRREDMTALQSEVESAVAEGVELLTLEAPTAIEVDENGHCAGVRMQPQMIGPVKGGRPAPVKANKPEHCLKADVVLVAVGQNIVTGPFEEFGMKAEHGCFSADEYLRAEGYDNIFVGGECQTGPLTVIRAIGAGKVAARNIDDYMGYSHRLDCGVAVPPPRENDRTPKGRVTIAERLPGLRKRDFEGVELPMSLEEARQECGRCLRCDLFGCGVLEGGRVQYD